MLSAATARALADVAARANDVLHAYDPSYVSEFDDARVAGRRFNNNEPLTAAAPDQTYFVVGTAGERRYTRDGRFAIHDGRLQTSDGADVLGYAPDAREPLPGTLRIDSVDAALGRANGVRIDADGTVAYTRTVVDPRTMQRVAQRVVAGTVALARFPAGTNMRRLDGIVPHVGRPAQDGFGPLDTRSRSTGATDVNLGIAKLQEAYLALRALGAAQNARSKLDAGAMDLIK